MNILSKIWNYKPSDETRRSIKSKAVNGIVCLLALMICFTLISRATSSMTVPIVDTENPSRSTISHTITVDGVLETTHDTGVVATQGALVQQVHIKQGDTVSIGDLLFTYDVTDFNQKISEYQIQLAQINTQIDSIKDQNVLSEADKELALERAKEDLDITDATADIEIKLAGERLRAARDALNKYDGVRRYEYDYYEDGEYTKSEYDQLRSEYRQAQIAYDKAVADKENSLLDAQRIIEDTERPDTDEASEELLRLDAQLINLNLSVLYDTVANDGEIYSPIDGVVTDVLVGAGTRTSNEAALFLSNSETINFVTEVSKDQKKYVNTGNTSKLRIAGETQDITGLEITSVYPSSTPNAYRVTIEMPADYLPGTSGTVEIQQQSKTYDTVVPLSALQAEGTQYYVLKVVETETSMGTEYFAQRVDVTLSEKNETYAAVTGAISAQDNVVSSSERSIQDGDRVRLQEKE